MVKETVHIVRQLRGRGRLHHHGGRGAGGVRGARVRQAEGIVKAEAATLMANEEDGRVMAKQKLDFTRFMDDALNSRWPTKGDQLLKVSSDRDEGFPQDGVSRHVLLWDGYMAAGNALDDACRKDPLERHDLIYPILFCYRHGVELAMKNSTGGVSAFRSRTLHTTTY